jgi:hypothetical protein
MRRTVVVGRDFGDRSGAEVRALVEAKQAEIAVGTLHPFQGSAMDQSGAVRVVEGSVMSDGDMLGFDWYVQGVLDKLPK